MLALRGWVLLSRGVDSMSAVWCRILGASDVVDVFHLSSRSIFDRSRVVLVLSLGHSADRACRKRLFRLPGRSMVEHAADFVHSVSRGAVLINCNYGLCLLPCEYIFPSGLVGLHTVRLGRIFSGRRVEVLILFCLKN